MKFFLNDTLTIRYWWLALSFLLLAAGNDALPYPGTRCPGSSGSGYVSCN